jgi:hypothetical protein
MEHDPVTNRPRATRARRWRRIGLVALVLLAAGGIARASLPWAAREYVVGTLDKSPLYQGKIGKLRIHLWRGAYSIEDVRIDKTTGAAPVPFFAAERVDFSLEWRALLHGALVGRMRLERPQLNFVDAEGESGDQTGAGGSWLAIVRELSPFRIDSASVHDGSVHFRAFEASEPVDVYLSQVEGTIADLTNIRDETDPYVAKVHAEALAMGQGEFELAMTLDPFSYRPTFKLGTRLIGLDATTLNDLARAYGGFDFERGWFDLVIEVEAKEGAMKGYVKPLLRDAKVFSAADDLGGGPIRYLWQALVGAVGKVLENPPREQLGTLIPFSGDLSGTTNADLAATVANVLRNAFVRAYLPRLESGAESVGGVEFEPPDFEAPISIGEDR